jgi:hypothetical protein
MDEIVSPAEEDFAHGLSPWPAHSDAAYSAHDVRSGSVEHSAHEAHSTGETPLGYEAYSTDEEYSVDETPPWCEAHSPNENYSHEAHCAHGARSPDGAHSL